MEDLGQRQARAAESILGNERLTDNLDDEAAQVLLDWGIRCAEEIVRQHAGTEDEVAAEEQIAHRLHAVRRLMRQVNEWAPRCGEMPAEKSAASLAGMIEQFGTIYDHDFPPPRDDIWSDLISYCDEVDASPKRIISLLRTLVLRQRGKGIETESHG
jgi:hypothetical protein